MGKSPGRWIRTVLFGKKSSEFHHAKGRKKNSDEKPGTAWTSEEDEALSSLVISHPIPVATVSSRRHIEPESQSTVHLPHSRSASILPQDTNFQESIPPQFALFNDERRRQEEAATLAQAAFRGYLARRAFRALKGIISLQALIRGHWVRRQAVATLFCVLGVVKLQALARGVKVRNSDIGLEVQRRWRIVKPPLVDSNEVHGSIPRARLSASAFVRKLVASLPAVMPLHLYYDYVEPNSAANWLERWSTSCFWKPIPQPKKIRYSKSQRKKGNFHMLEAETGRPKQSVRRVPAASIDKNISMQATAVYEKPKGNLRKAPSHPADTEQENPQSELEKVKRNLRTIYNPVMERSFQPEVEIEKPKLNLEKVLDASDDRRPVHSMNISDEKMKKETLLIAPGLPDAIDDASTLTLSELLEKETTSEPKLINEASEVHGDRAVIELKSPVENGGNNENTPTNGEIRRKDDTTSNENHKANRKLSDVAKQDRAENGLQNSSPSLPSYMAATESAKAKLRAQGSPRFSQDGAEEDNLARRHSLPPLANGKTSSQSPRTRTVHSGGKAGFRSNRPMLSREGNAKVIQVGWRR